MDKTVGFYWDPARANVQENLHLLEQLGTHAVFVPYRAVTQSFLQEVRSRGMQVYVDFSLFVGEEWWHQFPDSVPIDAHGQRLQPDEWYVPVCPNHPDIRRQLLQDVSHLIEESGRLIDGVWLDFIRYPVRWGREHPRLRQVCFCRHCLQLFLSQDTSDYAEEEVQRCARVITSERMAEWVEWKCERITDFVKDVRAIVSSSQQPVRLGMFALPWRATDHESAVRSIAGQDIEQLAPYVDVISPMTYHKLCYQPTAWIEQVIADFHRRTGKPILPIIQSLDLPTPIFVEEFDDALAKSLDAPTEGVMIFTLEPLVSDGSKQDIVRSRFR
jgi:uncharacterized lipoprotein YddW (UPF0748 family)